MNPINTVFDAKRLIGRKFSDAAVQGDMKLWPFKVISGVAEKPMIQVEFKGENKTFAAEEISSMVLIKMCVGCCKCAPASRSNLVQEGDRRGLPWQDSEERRGDGARLLQ